MLRLLLPLVARMCCLALEMSLICAWPVSPSSSDIASALCSSLPSDIERGEGEEGGKRRRAEANWVEKRVLVRGRRWLVDARGGGEEITAKREASHVSRTSRARCHRTPRMANVLDTRVVVPSIGVSPALVPLRPGLSSLLLVGFFLLSIRPRPGARRGRSDPACQPRCSELKRPSHPQPLHRRGSPRVEWRPKPNRRERVPMTEGAENLPREKRIGRRIVLRRFIAHYNCINAKSV